MISFTLHYLQFIDALVLVALTFTAVYNVLNYGKLNVPKL
jgi:hypothetical protein